MTFNYDTGIETDISSMALMPGEGIVKHSIDSFRYTVGELYHGQVSKTRNDNVITFFDGGTDTRHRKDEGGLDCSGGIIFCDPTFSFTWEKPWDQP